LDIESIYGVARDVEIKIEFYDSFGHLWLLCKNSISGNSIPEICSKVRMDCVFEKFPLNKGTYYLNVTISVQQQLADEISNVARIDIEQGLFYQTGKLPPPNKGFLSEYQWKIQTD